MKTEISGRADEKRLEEIRFCQLVDDFREVDVTSGDGNGATKAEKTI